MNLTVDADLHMETLCDRLSEQENADFPVNMNGDYSFNGLQNAAAQTELLHN